MPAKPENEFPTIRDVRDRLAELVDRGLGDLPVQLVVAPDSTMQAIARATPGFDPRKPALLIEFGGDQGRLPVSLISAERLRPERPNVTVQ